MKTQSPDTSIEAERILVEIIRQASVSKRFQLVQSMTQGTFLANISAWQENHPEASEVDAAVHFVSMLYGPSLAQCIQSVLMTRSDWHLQPAHLLVAMEEVIKLMNVFSIPWRLGGSLASSIYGMQQLAQDIDLVIDLHAQNLPAFIASLTWLKPHYAFDENTIPHMLDQHTVISLVHLDSLMKVDVIVTNNGMLSLPQPHEIRILTNEYATNIRVASVYEMILFKLYRYHQDQMSRQDGMTNDMEWNDIMSMLKVQGPELDCLLFDEELSRLHLEDVWESVLIDAGLRKA